ncbi:MAG: hypothetical protein HY560_10530, partial [Gemmatimonadetes bacterium]|nr:hypothetical protein [Gemmatimonadota bacterium]
FVGCQFHPELRSRPTRPHPLFASFVAAAVTQQKKAGTGSAAAQGALGPFQLSSR